MNPAQKDRLFGFAASLKARGVAVVIKPGDIGRVALVEVVDEQSRKRLQIADDLVTHVIHLRRDDLTGIALKEVSEIERSDCEQTYRVQHFKDDPQRPAVLFFATLA